MLKSHMLNISVQQFHSLSKATYETGLNENWLKSGSGIFTTPSIILGGTGSPAAAILLWAFGGLVTMTGVLCWIELGLSVPVQTIPGYLTVSGNEEEKSVPRSGGEKNFVS